VEDHSLLAVHDFLFYIIYLQLPSIYVGGSSTSNTWGQIMQWWQGTPLMWWKLTTKKALYFFFLSISSYTCTYSNMKIWHNNDDEFSTLKRGKVLTDKVPEKPLLRVIALLSRVSFRVLFQHENLSVSGFGRHEYFNLFFHAFSSIQVRRKPL
jgi:hypothetical protein